MTRPGLRAAVLTFSLFSMLAMPAIADALRHAVARPHSTVIVGARHYSPYYFYRPFYYGGYYGPGYYPFSLSFGFGYGYPYYGYAGYGYGGYPYYGPGPGYYGGYYGAALRLQVTPREAEAYIDGYYAGRVDNFDGTFQRLHLEPGEHDLEVFMPGHRSFTQKVFLQPGSTFGVKHVMEPLGAGEAEPTRPVAPPRSTRRAPEPSSRADRPTSRGSQQPATRPAERGESDFGSIALRVQPGDAMVTIDGERWEGAQDQDRLVVQLGAGTHTVEIRKDGYRTYTTDLTVHPGETTALNVSLTRQ